MPGAGGGRSRARRSGGCHTVGRGRTAAPGRGNCSVAGGAGHTLPTVVLEGLFTPMHLIIILAIALIVLGPKRLPEAGRSLGTAMRGFKESLTDTDHADRDRERAIEPPGDEPRDRA